MDKISKDFFRNLKSEEKRAVAKRCGINIRYLNNLIYCTGRVPGVRLAAKIEKATNHQVSKKIYVLTLIGLSFREANMSKYVPAKFAPVIYRSWANLFKNLTSDQKAEVLMAITLFPDYEPTIEIFAWDYIKAQLEQEYEKFLAKKEQAKNARALVDERRPTSTEGDERRPASTLVDLVPVPVPKKEIDKKNASIAFGSGRFCHYASGEESKKDIRLQT